jgi:hypothetical protein
MSKTVKLEEYQSISRNRMMLLEQAVERCW